MCSSRKPFLPRPFLKPIFMEAFIIRQGIVFLSFWALLVIVSKIRKREYETDLQGIPAGPEKEKLQSEILQLKRAGAGYRQCMEHLTGKGIRRGTARMLILEAERNQLAGGSGTPETPQKPAKQIMP